MIYQRFHAAMVCKSLRILDKHGTDTILETKRFSQSTIELAAAITVSFNVGCPKIISC